jgi:hypothetical protein
LDSSGKHLVLGGGGLAGESGSNKTEYGPGVLGDQLGQATCGWKHLPSSNRKCRMNPSILQLNFGI